MSEFPPVREADLEPPGRAVDAGSLEWLARRRFSLIETSATFFVRYSQLAGASWDCPRCSQTGAVSLTFRAPDFSWRCAACSFKRRFNGILADRLLEEIGAPSPR